MVRFFHASRHEFRVGDRVLSLRARGLPPKWNVVPMPDPFQVYLSDVPVHPTIMYDAISYREPWHVYEVQPVGPVSRGAYHDWMAREAIVIADHGPARQWISVPLSPDPWGEPERVFWGTVSEILGDREGAEIWHLYWEEKMLARPTSEKPNFDMGAVMEYLHSLPYPPETTREGVNHAHNRPNIRPETVVCMGR